MVITDLNLFLGSKEASSRFIDISTRNIVTFNRFHSRYIDRMCGFLNQIYESNTVKMLSGNVICFHFIFL